MSSLILLNHLIKSPTTIFSILRPRRPRLRHFNVDVCARARGLAVDGGFKLTVPPGGSYSLVGGQLDAGRLGWLLELDAREGDLTDALRRHLVSAGGVREYWLRLEAVVA